MSRREAFATGCAARRLRRATRLLALGAVLSSYCSVANAQSWQCRARAGTFDDRDIAVPRAATQLSGAMMIRKANAPGKWYPVAKVGFTDLSLAASGCHCNGIVAAWHPATPDSFLVSLSVDGKETPLGLVPYDKPVTFKLSFTWDGALKLEVGNRVVTGMSSTPIRDNLHLSCSTADVDFNIVVAPPPDRAPERCPFAAREQWTAADVDRYCRVRQ
ncbi:MAG: hypothetical protein WC804_11765 [Sphingomonas sp.]|uniref:hypothetical protein n=1 Tax=Sphingomonas sp. TaxID=28214 RepID=UPI0035656A5A